MGKVANSNLCFECDVDDDNENVEKKKLYIDKKKNAYLKTSSQTQEEQRWFVGIFKMIIYQ